MIGHLAARRYLEHQMPTAAVLWGPQSIGKWTLANHLADFHRIHVIDRWLVDHGLNVGTVRLIKSFAARAPQSRFKLIIACLDEAGRPALNALLKTLEEPPPDVKFLFTCVDKPASTVMSRCEPFELGALTTAELETVYLQQGFPIAKARRAAAYARGSVQRGYQAESADAHRIQVATLARALTTGDREGFTACFTAWDGHSSELLSVLLTECLTRRWHTFTEAEANGLERDRRRLWQMTAALMRVRSARPRLAVRAALEPFLIAR